MSPSWNGVVILLEDGTLLELTQSTSEVFVNATVIGGSPAGWCAVGAPEGLSCSPAELGESQLGTQDLIGVGIGDLGSSHLCTLYANGEVSCWGNEFSIGDCADTSQGPRYWCSTGDHTVNLGQPATSLTTDSRGFECALLEDGAVKCWGDAAAVYGVLGGSVEATADGGDDSHLVWNAIDLGTRR